MLENEKSGHRNEAYVNQSPAKTGVDRQVKYEKRGRLQDSLKIKFWAFLNIPKKNETNNKHRTFINFSLAKYGRVKHSTF